MPKGMEAIYTQTATSGNSASSFVFNNIPQNYTDLKVVMSLRSPATGTVYTGVGVLFNETYNSALYSHTGIGTDGSGSPAYFSTRTSSANDSFPSMHCSATSATSNTFSQVDLYIPNYSSALFKQYTSESIIENNATNAYGYVAYLATGLYRSTAPITSIRIANSTAYSGNSTVTIYGISR
jgi:hypothetical protein